MMNHPELAGGETSYFSPTPSLCTLLILALCFLVASPSNAGLSFDFDAASCPTTEFMGKNTLRVAPAMDPTIPGKLLHLLFLDCLVEEMGQRGVIEQTLLLDEFQSLTQQKGCSRSAVLQPFLVYTLLP
ncbi:hypothetical protein SLE2022_034000 [Rubroshorea leprosula]